MTWKKKIGVATRTVGVVALIASLVAAASRTPALAAPRFAAAANPANRLVEEGRKQVGVTTGYDPSYVRLSYPGGDVPASTGVCSDVVVRALRGLGIDLQERIHKDMKANFRAYSTKWGLKKPDRNIDHRRVRNISTYFARRGYSLAVSNNPADYRPGDIVSLQIPLDHIGIVSDRQKNGRPLLIHNVGQGTQEEDVLFEWKIVGHYRVLRN